MQSFKLLASTSILLFFLLNSGHVLSHSKGLRPSRHEPFPSNETQAELVERQFMKWVKFVGGLKHSAFHRAMNKVLPSFTLAVDKNPAKGDFTNIQDAIDSLPLINLVRVVININAGVYTIILFPIAVTFYITWWFIWFVDGFFSPIYAHLGISIFGLGFITSITFIFLVGVFMSSWLGASVLSLGEWFIKRMPFVRHIYNASKQISAAISPNQNTQAFKEVAIIRHPRIGEYAIGFITSSVVLQNYSGEEELCCVYVPTNHLYIGDVFLIDSKDVIRPNLSVREGIEIVVSVGMSMPQFLTTLDSPSLQERTRSN